MQKHIPGALLLAYAVYSGFIQINIAHSIILFSLAGLFGFHQFLSHQEKNKHSEKALEQLKQELETKLAQHEELYGKKLSKLEDELGKVSLSTIKASSSPSPSKSGSEKKYIF
jgi:hypothetical protein